MDLAYGLYMAECSGLLDTHESRMRRLLNDIAAQREKGERVFYLTPEYLAEFGFKFEDFTEAELFKMAQVADGKRF